MVYNSSLSTPQRHQPAGVFTPPKSIFRSPRAKTSKPRGNPYMTPERTRITISPGITRPMELHTPRDYKASLAKDALLRSSMSPPTHPAKRSPKPLLFPKSSEVRDPSSMLVSPPMQGSPRLEERPRGSMDHLLNVMCQCWDIDTAKLSSWTVTDALLNGRNDERDRSKMWNPLDYAVCKIWPELGQWIMCNRPTDDDITWFRPAERKASGLRIDDDNLKLDDKKSTLDRVGFHMTASTYDAACKVLQELAGPRRNRDLESLYSEINPFFLIYSCADCNIPLPSNFNRQLLWKHLDGIIDAKCWRGLTIRAKTDHHTNENADHVPPKFSKFSRQEEDPDDILQSLIKLSLKTAADDVPRPVHRLQIVIKDYKWMAKVQEGTVWYKAGDLFDDDDIACFAVIDCLTRWLPSFRGDILEIRADHVPLLWGVGGAPKGAWCVVRAVCDQYRVKLRARWADAGGLDPCERISRTENYFVPPRDRCVVDAVVNRFEQMQLNGSRTAYQRMMAHLKVTN